MKNETIAKHIDEFLNEQEILFSEDWKKKILSKLLKCNSESPEKKIRIIHDTLLQEMYNNGVHSVMMKYRDYGEDWAKDVVSNAMEKKWMKYFDGSKGIELPYLKQCIQSMLPEALNEEHPLIAEEDETDETGQVIYLKNGKPKKKQIRIKKIRDAFAEPVNSERQDEEEDPSSQEAASSEEHPFHGSLTYQTPDEDQHKPEYDKLSREYKLMRAHQYDKIRKKQKADSKKLELTHHITTSEILLRHYILKGVVAITSTLNMPIPEKYNFSEDADLRHMNGNFFKARWRMMREGSEK